MSHSKIADRYPQEGQKCKSSSCSPNQLVNKWPSSLPTTDQGRRGLNPASYTLPYPAPGGCTHQPPIQGDVLWKSTFCCPWEPACGCREVLQQRVRNMKELGIHLAACATPQWCTLREKGQGAWISGVKVGGRGGTSLEGYVGRQGKEKQRTADIDP